MSMALITDAGKSGTWECSGHTGNDRPPLDQPTILVTPIPDGTDTYTTPPFPVPDPKEFNDYILVFRRIRYYLCLPEGGSAKAAVL